MPKNTTENIFLKIWLFTDVNQKSECYIAYFINYYNGELLHSQICGTLLKMWPWNVRGVNSLKLMMLLRFSKKTASVSRNYYKYCRLFTICHARYSWMLIRGWWLSWISASNWWDYWRRCTRNVIDIDGSGENVEAVPSHCESFETLKLASRWYKK